MNRGCAEEAREVGRGEQDGPRTLVHDLLLGAAAGLAGTVVMDRVTTMLYERQNPLSRAQEERARGHRTADEMAAERAAALVGRALREDERKQLAQVLHRGLGAMAGAVYGGLRHRWGAGGIVYAMLFGTAIFLALDEGMNTATGLTPPPSAFPWQTHARGLVGHWAFALATGALVATEHRLLCHAT